MLRENESLIFKKLFDIYPGFAGRPIQWTPGTNPPDILCVDSSGNRLGIELADWLNEWQMSHRKAEERVETSYHDFIRTLEVQPPTNIRFIWLFPITELQPSDRTEFRRQLFDFIAAQDSDWLPRDDAHDPQGGSISDFAGYPTLGQYLSGMIFFPASTYPAHLGGQWIDFPAHGGAYSPRTAIDALRTILSKKTRKYPTLRADQQLSELHLLLYYDQAWIYNSPFKAPGYGFQEVVADIRKEVALNHGPFNRIFLFNAVDGELAAVWP